jgi:hypothetical protein
MLEKIRTFFGRVRGLHGDRRTVVEEGVLWRCTDCKMIFLSKQAWEQHKCQDQKLS